MQLVSIIVPVYNVEKYLRQCVKSLQNQTYSNIEVILVNDGSTDLSGSICEEIRKEDSRIRVIHKKNQGLGYARNTGLENAKGDYIAFLDSDDFVEVNMIEIMLKQMQQQQADTCFCSHNIYYDTGEVKKVLNPFSKEVYCGEVIQKELLLGMVGAYPTYPKDILVEMSVCFCIFSRSIIEENNIRFCSERVYISEDILFQVKYLGNAKKIATIPDALYYYRQNIGSLTHRYYPERFQKELSLYKKLDDELSMIFEPRMYQWNLERLFLSRTRTCIIQEICYNKQSFIKKCKNIKDMIKNDIVHAAVIEFPNHFLPLQQRVFNYLMKYKMTLLIYLLVTIRNRVKE